MSDWLNITNERDLRRARRRLTTLHDFISSTAVIDLLKAGIAPELIDAQRESAKSLIDAVVRAISKYESLKSMEEAVFQDIEFKTFQRLPITARIMHGSSQEEFANLLGIKQQQLQKYESEDYSSMKMGSFVALLESVGVRLEKISISRSAIQPASLKICTSNKILDYVFKKQWNKSVGGESARDTEVYIKSICSAYIRSSEGAARFRGNPSSSSDILDDARLIWLARVADLARGAMEKSKVEFDPLRIGYIKDLLALSVFDDGPKRAIKLLSEVGVTVIIEPNLPGLSIDGAAFSVLSRPIIGLTLRYDRIDSFWFTLLHELGHVHLHQARGLDRGFVDDFDSLPNNDIEQEADRFALEVVMPLEKWRLSPARLANKPEPVMRLAHILNVNAAILFGRIRKERGYKLFSDLVGQGQIRKLFN